MVCKGCHPVDTPGNKPEVVMNQAFKSLLSKREKVFLFLFPK